MATLHECQTEMPKDKQVFACQSEKGDSSQRNLNLSEIAENEIGKPHLFKNSPFFFEKIKLEQLNISPGNNTDILDQNVKRMTEELNAKFQHASSIYSSYTGMLKIVSTTFSVLNMVEVVICFFLFLLIVLSSVPLQLSLLWAGSWLGSCALHQIEMYFQKKIMRKKQFGLTKRFMILIIILIILYFFAICITITLFIISPFSYDLNREQLSKLFLTQGLFLVSCVLKLGSEVVFYYIDAVLYKQLCEYPAEILTEENIPQFLI